MFSTSSPTYSISYSASFNPLLQFYHSSQSSSKFLPKSFSRSKYFFDNQKILTAKTQYPYHNVPTISYNFPILSPSNLLNFSSPFFHSKQRTREREIRRHGIVRWTSGFEVARQMRKAVVEREIDGGAAQ
ncbi:hypothetical protein M0R45_010085 [Rubus argutus]|uniref:Uncharacterized protein n=1 Tax=Rubus argutus TaxID=59490 RepID=A0AAW1Y6S6_RUBAR